MNGSEPVLQVGSKGASVGVLQQVLIEAGESIDHDELMAGAFASSTDAAVKHYQAAHGLTADGVVGPKTWATLNGSTPGDAPVGWRMDPVPPAIQPVMDAATKLVGIVEAPPASNRGPEIDALNVACGIPLGSPWCCAFATGMWMAAASKPFKKPIGGVYTLQDWAVKKKVLLPATAKVQPGDLFLIIRDGGHGHTGIVAADLGDQFATIEGNAGNACKRLIRSKADMVGFVRPLG
jgi:Putative peptidoglycan binding domain/CHAP domain